MNDDHTHDADGYYAASVGFQIGSTEPATPLTITGYEREEKTMNAQVSRKLANLCQDYVRCLDEASEAARQLHRAQLQESEAKERTRLKRLELIGQVQSEIETKELEIQDDGEKQWIVRVVRNGGDDTVLVLTPDGVSLLATLVASPR